jgi:hypothetical protein
MLLKETTYQRKMKQRSPFWASLFAFVIKKCDMDHTHQFFHYLFLITLVLTK